VNLIPAGALNMTRELACIPGLVSGVVGWSVSTFPGRGTSQPLKCLGTVREETEARAISQEVVSKESLFSLGGERLATQMRAWQCSMASVRESGIGAGSFIRQHPSCPTSSFSWPPAGFVPAHKSVLS